MNFLGFGQSADIEIVFDGAESRKMAEIKTEDGKKEKYLLYYDGETVAGKVNVTLKKPGSKLEHQGIKIELVGQIELYYDRGNHHEFAAMVKELARPGDLIQNTSYPFEFANVEKPYEVYVGSNVRLRYFLRVTIVRRLSDIVRETDIAVHTLCSYPEVNSPIKMEVGIEDCLHIEFEYNKSKYHLKDVIVGKIYFLLVRIKIKHMEIAIIKRETTGTGPNSFIENETIAKYEIMDGAPVKGESIPIRVFLAGYDLTPTMRDINKKFSVRYFLNLVLLDTEDRRYFKQQEITLWRKAEKSARNSNNKMLTTAQQQQQQMHLHYTFGSSGINNNLQLNEDGSIQRVLSGPTVDPTMGLFTQESPQQESKSEQQSPLSSSSSTNLPKTKKDFSPLNVDNDDERDNDNDGDEEDDDDNRDIDEDNIIRSTDNKKSDKEKKKIIKNVETSEIIRKVIKNDEIDDDDDDVSTVMPNKKLMQKTNNNKKNKSKNSSTLFNDDDGDEDNADNEDNADEKHENVNVNVDDDGNTTKIDKKIHDNLKKQTINEKKTKEQVIIPPLMQEQPQTSD